MASWSRADCAMTAPEVTRYPDAAALLQAVQQVLEQNEAEHSLMLGMLLSIARSDPMAPRPEVLATVGGQNGWSLAAMQTPPHPLVLCAAKEASVTDTAVLAAHFRREGLAVPGVVASVPLARQFADEWAKSTGVTAEIRVHQRVHCLRAVQVATTIPGRLRLAAPADLQLVRRWFAEFAAEALGEHDDRRSSDLAARRIEAGQVYLWEDTEPRSIAAWGRPTRNTISVSGVYTPPAWRSRGYATAAVAELSRQLLAKGHPSCVLYTDLNNPVSNSIYQRIGYEPVADSLYMVFQGEV